MPRACSVGPLLTTPLKGPDNQIYALETPIEARDFVDVNAAVTGSGLDEAKTVGGLRDVIWDGIPAANRA